MAGERVLIARMDDIGGVLLAGPCVRAVAEHAGSVALLTGPRGRPAADLLPGVDEIAEWCAPWIDPEPPAVTPDMVDDLVKQVADLRPDRALILTSAQQSPLPLALALRMAGVPWVGGISDDYPGSLLDLRLELPPETHEAERALALAQAAGYHLPEHDDGRLIIGGPLPNVQNLTGKPGYVVVHPGASAPARAPSTARSSSFVQALVAAGHRVVVTGGPEETELTSWVAGTSAIDLGGQTDLRELAAVLDHAIAVVTPNSAPAHLAAAVSTAVVSLFAPVVPASCWAPYQVPSITLGDQDAACRDTRARICPVSGHPCLESITPRHVVNAVADLTGFRHGSYMKRGGVS